LSRVAVRRGGQLPGVGGDPLQAGRGRAGGTAEVAPLAADRGALAALAGNCVDVHDPARSRRGLGRVGRAGAGLALPRRGVAAGANPARAVPRHAGAGQVGAAAADALAEREHVEAVAPGLEGVGLAAGEVDEAVAGGDRVRGRAVALVLPREAAAAKHPEDLLLGVLDVRGRRPLSRRDRDPLQADRGRAGGRAEVAPFGVEVAGGRVDALHVVPVRDPAHAGGHYYWVEAMAAAGSSATSPAGGAVTWTGTPKSNMSRRTSIAIFPPVAAMGTDTWYARRRTRSSWPIQTSIGIRWVPSIATRRASDLRTAARSAAGAFLAALSRSITAW